MVDLIVPFTFKQLDHLVLRTENIEDLREFYLGLGCNVVRDQRETLGLLQLSMGASMLDLVDVHGQLGQAGGAGPGPTGRNLDHFAVRVEPFDIDRIVNFCRGLGVNVTPASQPLLGADGYGEAVYIEDPDGNRIELKGPPVDENEGI